MFLFHHTSSRFFLGGGGKWFVCLFFFIREGTFGRHFVIFGIILGAFFFFFHTVGDLFCCALVGVGGAVGAPARSVSLAPRGGAGGARLQLLYIFLFSVSKVTAD